MTREKEDKIIAQAQDRFGKRTKKAKGTMTAKELQEKCMALQQECNDKQRKLRKQYAIEHNPVKMGDIVTDHYHTIRVEKMGIFGLPVPYMVYHGTELTKQGIPKKRQPVPDNPAFQKNVRRINGEPYQYMEEEL